jgi:methionyl aminopeptidase
LQETFNAQMPNLRQNGAQGHPFLLAGLLQILVVLLSNSWKDHKLLHKLPEQPFNPWPTYKYAGTLRPVYPLSPKRPVKLTVGVPDYAMHPQGYSQSEQALRGTNKIKTLDAGEIEKMRVVCRLGREVLDIGAKAIKGKLC